MRFLFSPPDETAVGLLTLPWAEPLQTWNDSRLVEVRQRGISRHVVRFVAEGGCLYRCWLQEIETAEISTVAAHTHFRHAGRKQRFSSAGGEHGVGVSAQQYIAGQGRQPNRALRAVS